MKINNADRVRRTFELIEEFRVFSRVLDECIDSLTHCVYSINRKDDSTLLKLQRKYRELIKEFKELQISVQD